jgi:hypothetical protein
MVIKAPKKKILGVVERCNADAHEELLKVGQDKRESREGRAFSLVSSWMTRAR